MLQFSVEKENALKTYYEKGLFYQELNMPGASINAFNKCIEYKEEGNYKACYELSKVYVKFQDFDAAYDCCAEAIRLNPQYIQAFYYIVHILQMMKFSINELKIRIENFLYLGTLNYSIIAHIFYMEELYETALEYINKYEEENMFSDDIELLKVKCLIRISKYEECIKFINTIQEKNLYFFIIMMYKVICFIVINKYESIWNVFNEFNNNRLNNYNKKVLSVYMQFCNLFTGFNNSILCEDENDLDYSSCIFEICDILLINKENHIFEKTLNLLNLISDKSVLLQLGKLYYKHGYIELAKKEIIRSIKLFELIDTEALDILITKHDLTSP